MGIAAAVHMVCWLWPGRPANRHRSHTDTGICGVAAGPAHTYRAICTTYQRSASHGYGSTSDTDRSATSADCGFYPTISRRNPTDAGGSGNRYSCSLAHTHINSPANAHQYSRANPYARPNGYTNTDACSHTRTGAHASPDSLADAHACPFPNGDAGAAAYGDTGAGALRLAGGD